MAETTLTLDPREEIAFLDKLGAFTSSMAKLASGGRLAVVAHYQQQYEAKRASLERTLGKSKRKTARRKNEVAQ